MTVSTCRPWSRAHARRLAAAALAALIPAVTALPAHADALSDKKAEAAKLAAQLDADGNRISVLAEKLDEATLKAADLGTQVQSAQKNLDQVTQATQASRGALIGQAVDVYTTGGVGLGSAPVGDGQVVDGLLRRQYTQSLQAQQVDALDAMRAQVIELKDAQNRLQAAQKKADGAVAAVRQAQADAASADAADRADLAKAQGDLAGLVQQAQQAQADREAAAVQAKIKANTFHPKAPSTGSTPAPKTFGPPPPVGHGAGAAIAMARAQLGKPYRYGAAGPDSYDCSGLTMVAWRNGGVSLPHSSSAQYGVTAHVPVASAQPGDLFFYGSPIHHVAIYIGGGQIIEAPHTGTDVRVSNAYRSDLVGVGRP